MTDSAVFAPLSSSGHRQIARQFGRRWNYFYVKSKLRTDPVYASMMKVLHGSKLPLLDLGCGLGLFAFYLKEGGFPPPIHGCDVEAPKIHTAQKIANEKYPGVTFSVLDVRDALPPHQGNVSILDILQYLTPEQQKTLLVEAASRVAPGGHLLIRSGLLDKSWRCRVSQVIDRFASKIRWIAAHPINLPEASLIVSTLEDAGLGGKFHPLWGGTPFNNHLFIFQRPLS